jgi:type IV pilus assembly protein PilA
MLEKKAKPSRGGDAKPRGRTSQDEGQPGCLKYSNRRSAGGEGFDSKLAPHTRPKGIQMFSAVKERLDREEDGFTLIELMVVLLIIAILLAIAIPTFLGARQAANARATQEDLRNALTAEQTYWTANQTFATNLASTEVSLIWETAAPVKGASDVYATTWNFGSPPTSVTIGSSDSVMLEGFARDNNCYAIFQSDNASTDFTAYYQEASIDGACPSITPPGAEPTAGSMASTNTGGSATDGGWSATF